jgi:FtsH-binding integral membrane protein
VLIRPVEQGDAALIAEGFSRLSLESRWLRFWGLGAYIAAFACLIGLQFAVRRGSAATGLLFAFGGLMGLAIAPTLAYYASTNPEALWQAGAATALFMAGLGAAGYAS